MSFPNMMFGPRGTEKKQSSVATAELGQLLQLRDGRSFRYIKNSSAAALDAGVLAQSAANLTTAHLSTLSILSVAVGGKELTLSSALATTISTVDFTDGFVVIQNTTAVTGAGRLYQIEDIALTCAVSTNKITLKDGVETALTSGSAEVSILKNPFRNVIIHPSPPTNRVVGWSQTSISTGYFGWVCVQGPTAAMFDMAPILGKKVRASTALDGAVTQDFYRMDVATTAAWTSGTASQQGMVLESDGTTGSLMAILSSGGASGVFDAGIADAACGVAMSSGVTSAEFGVVWAQVEG